MLKKTFSKSVGPVCRTGLVVTLLMSAGCGEHSAKLTDTDRNAFAGAPAEIKQQWEKALAADKASDYVTAQTLLDGLTQASLDVNQKAALEKERASFGERVWAAAEKENPSAIKAVQAAAKSKNQKRVSPAR